MCSAMELYHLPHGCRMANCAVKLGLGPILVRQVIQYPTRTAFSRAHVLSSGCRHCSIPPKSRLGISAIRAAY